MKKEKEQQQSKVALEPCGNVVTGSMDLGGINLKSRNIDEMSYKPEMFYS